MSKLIRLTFFAAALAAMGLPARAVEPGAPEALITLEKAVGIKVRQAVSALAIKTETAKAVRDALERFYSDRSNVPVWVVREGLGARAKAVIKEFGDSARWGLEPANYAVVAPGSGAAVPALVEAELALSKAVVSYAQMAHSGRIDPALLSRNIDRGSTLPEPYAVLKGAADAADPAAYLLAFHPKHEQFLALKRKLAELRGSVDEPAKQDEIELPSGPVLKPGMTHPQIVLLRRRLKAELPTGTDPALAEIYDDALFEAVKAFQTAKGLKADGLVGRGVRAAMNGVVAGAPSQQLERILVNMERWRWMQEDMGETFVWNNVPDFVTRVISHGKTVFSERIVVGKPDTPTPLFSDEIEFVEFHPYWNVPDSIKSEEILPSLQRGADIMSAQNLRVKYRGREIDAWSVDWSTANVRNFHFYQPPGGGNVLGVVKFMFPNRHDVYMHDTPSKSLFAQSVRAYSHGCMRVRNPVRFAEVLLGIANGWGASNVSRALAQGNQQVPLGHKIPIHISYFTAFVEDDGKLTFRGDIYGADRRLARALGGDPSVLAEESLLAVAGKRTRIARDSGPSFSDSRPGRFTVRDLLEGRTR